MATEEKTHRHQRRSTLQQGAFAGIIAGIIFGLMEIVGAVAMGMPALMPLRMFASIILGSAALEDVALGTAAIVGIIVHLVLSGVFGAIYGLLNARADTETQTSMGRQAGLGLVFGFAVWLVNFHIIARLLYPWFLGTPQFLQMMLHVVFFGLPLALLFAYRERRIHGAAQMPRAA